MSLIDPYMYLIWIIGLNTKVKYVNLTYHTYTTYCYIRDEFEIETFDEITKNVLHLHRVGSIS